MLGSRLQALSHCITANAKVDDHSRFGGETHQQPGTLSTAAPKHCRSGPNERHCPGLSKAMRLCLGQGGWVPQMEATLGKAGARKDLGVTHRHGFFRFFVRSVLWWRSRELASFEMRGWPKPVWGRCCLPGTCGSSAADHCQQPDVPVAEVPEGSRHVAF